MQCEYNSRSNKYYTELKTIQQLEVIIQHTAILRNCEILNNYMSENSSVSNPKQTQVFSTPNVSSTRQSYADMIITS
jgi:hypothetical protein